MNKIKTLINSLLRHFGVELRSVLSAGKMFSESFRILKTVLPDSKFTVIDVGVASGTPELYRAFPSSKHAYLLVEASPLYVDHVRQLGKNMGAVVEEVFCGDHNGEESFIARTVQTAEKGSKYARASDTGADRVTVKSATLDSLIEKNGMRGPFILKIDVEVAELEVLRGASDTLLQTEAVIIETPIIVRMEGAADFGQIVKLLTESGFALFDIAEISYSKKTSFMNLSNGIFLKKNNPLWKKAWNAK